MFIKYYDENKAEKGHRECSGEKRNFYFKYAEVRKELSEVKIAPQKRHEVVGGKRVSPVDISEMRIPDQGKCKSPGQEKHA